MSTSAVQYLHLNLVPDKGIDAREYFLVHRGLRLKQSRRVHRPLGVQYIQQPPIVEEANVPKVNGLFDHSVH